MDSRMLERIRDERLVGTGTGSPWTSTVLRGLTAAGLLLSADVHLVLYANGYSQIAVIGPLFLVNVVAGLAIGLAVLLTRHSLALLGAAGFGLATLGAYLASRTVGLFGVREMAWDAQAALAAGAEVAAVLGAVLVWLVEHGRRRDDRVEY